MKNKIIETAGKIWRVLGQKKEVELLGLPELVQEKEEIVFQALGWLAREDKINYFSLSGEDYVRLVGKEQEVYQREYGAKCAEKKGCCSGFNLKKLFQCKVF